MKPGWIHTLPVEEVIDMAVDTKDKADNKDVVGSIPQMGQKKKEAPPTFKKNIAGDLGGVNFNAIPQEFKDSPQWVVWRAVEADGKIKKIPCSPAGGYVAGKDPANWLTFDEAKAAYETGRFSGVGYQFTHEDGLAGIDIDNCIEDGRISSRAETYIKMARSYCEWSPSGGGFHILVKHEGGYNGVNIHAEGLETYCNDRFFTMTGNEFSLDGTTGNGVVTGKKVVGSILSMAKKLNPAAAMERADGGGGERQFSSILTGLDEDTQVLITDGVPTGGRSEALFKVYNYLIIAGYSVENIIATIKQHPNGIGEKFYSDWKGKEAKLRKDIQRALDSLRVEPQVGELLNNYALMEDGSRVIGLYDHPLHALRSLADFKNRWANSKVRTIGAKGGVKMIPAVNLWLGHAARKAVRGEKFFPGEDRIFGSQGDRFYNSFYFIHDNGGVDGGGPIAEDKRSAKAKLFLDHVSLLFNHNQADVDIFLDWLAFLIQHPELRPQWVVFIMSEVQGVGKGTLATMISSILGMQLVNTTTMANLAEQGGSTGWGDYGVDSKLVVIHEVKDAGKKYEVNDVIRSKITDSPLYLNLKGGKNVSVDVFFGFLWFSNYLDALNLPSADRRIWPVLCEMAADKQKELLKSGHFKDCKEWAKSERNCRAVFELLKARDIKTDVMGNAPVSGLKQSIITDSKSELECAFDEALDELSLREITTGVVILSKVNERLEDIKRESGEVFFKITAQDREYKVLMKQKTRRLHSGKPIKCGDKSRRLIAIRNFSKWVNSTEKECGDEYQLDGII